MPGTGYSKGKKPFRKSPKKKATWRPKKFTAKAKQAWAIRKSQEERLTRRPDSENWWDHAVGCPHQFENRPEGGSVCIFCKTFMYAQLRVTGQGELAKDNSWSY